MPGTELEDRGQGSRRWKSVPVTVVLPDRSAYFMELREDCKGMDCLVKVRERREGGREGRRGEGREETKREGRKEGRKQRGKEGRKGGEKGGRECE